MSPKDSPRLLGAVLAGGGSRRFGANKAMAELHGEPMVRRACRLVAPRVTELGVVAHDPAVEGTVDCPVRPDVRGGLGPVGGILTALSWARELQAVGALVLACDLPLVPGSLLNLLVEEFSGGRPVAPASPGPLGLEPLCAVYPVRSLEAVEERLAVGPLSAYSLLEGLSAKVIPLETVASVCDPSNAFLNVNRAVDLWRAEALMAAESG